MDIITFLFNNTNTRQILIKNTFWSGVSSVFSKIIRVAVIIYIAKILGTENYGVFTYAMSLVAMFSIFSDIGLSSILIREITKNKNNEHIISTTVITKLILLFLTIILAILFIPLITNFEEIKPLIWIMVITLMAESFQTFLYGLYRFRNKIEKEALVNILSEIIITASIFIFFLTGPNIKNLALSYLIGGLISLSLTITTLRVYLRNIFVNFQKDIFISLTKNSWPFLILSISGVFMSNVDSLFIGYFGNAHLLGLYAAAQKPISLIRILPNFLSVALFPLINKFSGKNDQNKLNELINKSTKASLMLALPIMAGGLIMAKPIFNSLFGSQFAAASLTFQILLISLLIVFPGSIIFDLIIAENKQSLFIKSSILGAVTNVMADLILIPKFGINGSAIATILALLISNGYLFLKVKDLSILKILKTLPKVILATLIMSALAYLMKELNWPIIIIVTSSAPIYFLLLRLLKDSLLEEIILSLKK